jgi:hypothetical protein
MKGRFSCLLVASVVAATLTLPLRAGLAQGMQPSKESVLQSMGIGGMSAQPSKERIYQLMGTGVGIQAAGVCSLCFTCGAEWPNFTGAIPTREGAAPVERGPGCSGDLAPQNDLVPFLCCR